MKRLLVIIALFIVPVFAGDGPQHGQVLGVSGGRYVFGQIGDSILSTFMLDTQTGRLWKYEVNKETAVILSPVPYFLTNGSVSYVPGGTLEIQVKDKGQKGEK